MKFETKNAYGTHRSGEFRKSKFMEDISSGRMNVLEKKKVSEFDVRSLRIVFLFDWQSSSNITLSKAGKNRLR